MGYNGRDNLIVIWNNHILTEIEFRGTFDMRQTGTDTVHILIDPWYDNPAIWQFNITTLEFKIIKPFIDYKNREYTDEIIW